MDMCMVTETWLPQDDLGMSRLIPPPGYNIISTPRTTGSKGGGVATIYRDHLNISQSEFVHKFETMEYQELRWKLSDRTVFILLIYFTVHWRFQYQYIRLK